MESVDEYCDDVIEHVLLVKARPPPPHPPLFFYTGLTIFALDLPELRAELNFHFRLRIYSPKISVPSPVIC